MPQRPLAQRMPVSEIVVNLIHRTRALPVPVRYGATIGMVAIIFALQQAVAPWLPEGYPILPFFIAILLSAALFDHGTGLLAVTLSALLATTFPITPDGHPRAEETGELVAIGLFVAVGATMAFVIEALHRAIAAQRAAHAELLQSERKRILLLHEFRHRTRNDLGSLVGLLHLRARAAGSAAAQEGLREAAQHALALARVHTRLSAADLDDGVMIDTSVFLHGLCADLGSATAAEGLRPVVLTMDAEAHPLDSERGVQLGLVLNETITNALKYAFPEDRQGRIHVRFWREGGEFVLTVTDDGIGLPPEGDLDPAPSSAPHGSGLGTRLLRALAAQLRGSFARHPGPGGSGTLAELRFPVPQPGRRP